MISSIRDKINQLQKRNQKIIIGIVIAVLTALIWILITDFKKKKVLNVKEVEFHSFHDIIPVSDSLVTPVLYKNVKGLNELEGDSLKQTFIRIVLPAILIAKHHIEKRRNKVLILTNKKRWDESDSIFYKVLADEYKAKSPERLLHKMVTHPNSIVLAQAALESGWGTSRFFRQANNIFGIWSFDPDEPRIRAAGNRGKRGVYLRKYQNLSESIEDYFVILARAGVYKKFRDSRVNTDDPYEIVDHLIHYSERRWDYVKQLKIIMRQNELTKYDQYTLDPAYFVEVSKADVE